MLISKATYQMVGQKMQALYVIDSLITLKDDEIVSGNISLLSRSNDDLIMDIFVILA